MNLWCKPDSVLAGQAWGKWQTCSTSGSHLRRCGTPTVSPAGGWRDATFCFGAKKAQNRARLPSCTEAEPCHGVCSPAPCQALPSALGPCFGASNTSAARLPTAAAPGARTLSQDHFPCHPLAMPTPTPWSPPSLFPLLPTAQKMSFCFSKKGKRLFSVLWLPSLFFQNGV